MSGVMKPEGLYAEEMGRCLHSAGYLDCRQDVWSA